MKILITGSSGFIGRHLVDSLIDRGEKVAALDLQEAGRHPRAAWTVACNILDEKALAAAVTEFGPEVIVHLAARTDLNEKDDLRGYAANTDGVTNLLSCVVASSTVRRVLYTSSQLVCAVGRVPANELEYCPNTVYGQSKVITEQLVRAADGASREWVLLRPTTVWGPGMSAHYQRFLAMIKAGRYFHVGNNPLLKSYSYIGNIVYQYMRIIDAPAHAINRRTLYLADYKPIDLIDWANCLQREMDARRIPTLPLGLARGFSILGDLIAAAGFERFPFTSFRLNNVLTQYVFDLSSTEKIVGPLPFDMEAGVRQTVEWFRTQTDTA